MSSQDTKLRTKRPRDILCLFCNSSGQLVEEPKEKSFLTIKNAAIRRKDYTSDRFKLLFNPESNVQCFSWHRNCMASYVSEEKIRYREKALLKLQQAKEIACTSNPNTSTSSKSIASSSNICIICSRATKYKDKQLCLCSKLSAAHQIFNTAHIKQDKVFTEISTCKSAQDLLAKEIRYHTICYRNYVRVRSINSGKPVGRPSSKLPPEQLLIAFEKLIDEIKDKMSTRSFEITYLAARVAELTEIEDAVVENRDMKTLLIDKYGEQVLFSYPTERSKSSMVFMGNIPLSEVIECVRQLDSTDKVETCAKELRKEALGTKLAPNGYLCDENLIDNTLKKVDLPPKWKTFMQTLFNAKNQQLGESALRKASSVYCDIFNTITNEKNN